MLRQSAAPGAHRSRRRASQRRLARGGLRRVWLPVVVFGLTSATSASGSRPSTTATVSVNAHDLAPRAPRSHRRCARRPTACPPLRRPPGAACESASSKVGPAIASAALTPGRTREVSPDDVERDVEPAACRLRTSAATATPLTARTVPSRSAPGTASTEIAHLLARRHVGAVVLGQLGGDLDARGVDQVGNQLARVRGIADAVFGHHRARKDDAAERHDVRPHA